MQFLPALILGLVGSLHCAGMCGPLAMAIPATGNTRMSFTFGRLAYNFGRVTTYCLLGVFFGCIGLSFVMAGFQRWASIVAGATILIGLTASTRLTFQAPVVRAVAHVRSRLGLLMKQRTYRSIYLLGILNGFLPCGMVYVAGAGAVAAGGFVSGVGYMLAFGLGTIPMMLSIGLAGKLVHVGLRLRYQKLIPVSLAILATLLIMRGLALGIPYLSPALTQLRECCH